MSILVKDAVLLSLAKALAVTLKDLKEANIVFPNEEPLFRRVISLLESTLNGNSECLHLKEKQLKELATYFQDMAEAVDYDIMTDEYLRKHQDFHWEYAKTR